MSRKNPMTVEGAEKANKLLGKERLGLPAHRRYVSACGTNIKWLRKNLPTQASTELKQLIGSTR